MYLLAVSRNALIVEANCLIASVIEGPLLDLGYAVVVATHIDQAVALVDAQDFDFAIIDFRSQHGHSSGLIAKLNRRAIPFTFYTASSTEEVYETFPNTLVMHKPCSDDELLAKVAAMAHGAISATSSAFLSTVRESDQPSI